MTAHARVGIVVRTKNRPAFLARALRDINAQTYSDWVVSIVNDGGDAAAVDAVIDAAPGQIAAGAVRVHNAVPTGRSAAANTGVRSVSSDYIVLHDDDDLWHPAFLAETVRWLEENPGDIGVVTRTDIVYEEEKGERYEEVGRETFWASLDAIRFVDLLEVNRWVPIGYLYRRELHDRVGYYDEDIHAAEDWDLGLRTLARYSIGLLDGEALAYWMQRRGVDGEIGNSMFVLAGDHARYDALIRDRALREYVAREGMGLPLYLAGERRRERESFREIVREEVKRELDARPSDLDRLRRKLHWRRRRA